MIVGILTIIMGIFAAINFILVLIFGNLPKTMHIIAIIAIIFSILFIILGINMINLIAIVY